MKKLKLLLQKFYIYLLILFVGFLVADLGIMWTRPLLISSQPPPSTPKHHKVIIQRNMNYRIIESRNVFHADGKIPKPLSDGASEAEDLDMGLADNARSSSLPLELLGTIVHFNPHRSVATVKLRGRNKTFSYLVGEKIESLALVQSIKRRKIFFKNLNNNRYEYIEIPEKTKLSFAVGDKKGGGKSKSSSKKKRSGVIKQTKPFEFVLKRSDLKKYTQNLSGILSQARMLPRTSGGKVNGFRFVSIKPDSIYTQLGFKVGDVIVGVNGDPVDSPAKAMELYQALKTSDEVELQIERNGKKQKFKYKVH